jgi:tetratricopeptide (TPR) repeat protein
MITSPSDQLRAARLALALSVLLIAPLPARGHADLLAMIEGISKRLENDPKNASLHFMRAELYRTHADWKLAEADYDSAGQLDPKLSEVDLGRGKLLFESGRNTDAKANLDKYLAAHTNDVDALITRAQLLSKIGDRPAAVADYTRAITASAHPRPDYFLERAKLQSADRDLAAALQGLDEGLLRLGPLITLQLSAVELECSRHQYEEALKRLEKISAAFERKEKWLARRGEILVLANRRDAAQASFAEALKAIESLPPRLRATPEMLQLKEGVEKAMKAQPPTLQSKNVVRP